MSESAENREYHSPSLAYETYMHHNQQERAHFEDVCRSYRQYATFALCHWKNQERRYQALPDWQKSLLPEGLQTGTAEAENRAGQHKDAAIRNQFCLDCILNHAGVPNSQEKASDSTIVSDDKVSKVSSVLKSLARDWSSEGKGERDMAYEPILQAVQNYLPMDDDHTKEVPRLCVPGAGVGRLAMELTSLGYEVQGNEFSLHMLLASDFMLNANVCSPDKQFAISPWLLESRNVHKPTDPFRKVMIPDVDPQSILIDRNETERPAPEFSVAAGDFASIYNSPSQFGQWNAVICCFFLDAAPNLIDYIQIIYNMLCEGGVLINFGPLLYHWSGPAMRPDDATYEDYQARFAYMDKRYLVSIDLCWEDIRTILMNVGFAIEEERVGVPSLYTADRRSMMNMSYRCIHFVARKQSEDEGSSEEDAGDEVMSFS